MKEQIISEIKRLAIASGGIAPGMNAFEKLTGIRRHEWNGKYWAKWSDAVSEAGLKPNERTKKLDRDFLNRTLAAVVRQFGREPTNAEYNLFRQSTPGTPRYQTLIETFGTKTSVFQELRIWASQTAGFDDVAALLPAIESHAEQTPTSTSEGYVYLIKSGGYYKIGRGDELEKRVKQIRVNLPDASNLEHAIRTDDPPGIEAYWHRRFADRRANGEWFKLTSADVVAFKRRKYQ